MQGLMQQPGPQREALLQLLSMLQQLFSGQQQTPSAGAGTGSGSGAAIPGTSAEEGAPLSAPLNAAGQPVRCRFCAATDPGQSAATAR